MLNQVLSMTSGPSCLQHPVLPRPYCLLTALDKPGASRVPGNEDEALDVRPPREDRGRA